MKRFLVVTLSLAVLFGLVLGPRSWTNAEAWQPVSGPYGGSVAALALSPNYAIDHTVFAGLRGQGIYRTTYGGSSWHVVSPADWVVIDLAVSPAYASDGTIFATSGLPMAGFSVHRSADEGDTWEDVTPSWIQPPSEPSLAISSNFAADHTLYVLGGQYVYVSTNSGDTFTAAPGWLSAQDVVEMAFSPDYATDQTLFALARDEGLFKSTDGGATWNPTGLSGSFSTFAVSPDFATDQMLIAVSATDGQLYTSIDGGDIWSTGALTLGTSGQHTLLFSSTFATDRILLAASSADPGPYRSDDGGTTWLPVGWYDPGSAYLGGFIGGSVFALALAPDTSYDAAAFAGTSSGIYRSNNWGVNWYQGNYSLARLTVRALTIAPGDPTTLLAGTSFFEHLRFDTGTPDEQDGNLQLSTDGGQSWRDVSGRLDRVHNVVFSPDFATDQTGFAATGSFGQDGFHDGGVYRSTDGGQNWSEVLGDLMCEALAISPDFSTDDTLWVSASTYTSALGIYTSTDGGDNWTSLAPSVHAQVLVPSPNYAVDQTLFAGTHDNGLQRSTDGGVSWAQVLTVPITSLALSPAYGASQTLYAGVQEGEAPGAIYRSTDGGETWQRLDTGIPSTWEDNPVTMSVLTFAVDGSVLAGISYGNEAGGGAVYRSTDGGETWQALGSGLSAYNVFALATTPSRSMTFYAGTCGGLWELGVPQGGPAEPGTWETGGPRGGRAQALAVSPDFENDGVAFSGEWLWGRYGTQSGLGIFKSTDGAQTWQLSASSPSAVHDFAFSPDFATDQAVFAATWGGLFKSTDGGENWQWLIRLYSGPPGSVTAVAVAPDYPDSGHVLACSGWGGLYLSQDGGVNWTKYYTVAASSAVVYSPDFSVDGVALASGLGVYRTTDSGASWTQVLTQAISVLAISPQFGADGTIFAGGDALYISHDGGAGWISSTISLESPRINALVISPAFDVDQTLLAGTNSGLYRSGDGGVSWEPVASYPGQAVLSLAVSPAWPDHPVLLVGTAAGVYRTADGGATWARTQGAATLHAQPITLAPDGDLLLAGAHDHGVYGSTDGGGNWFPLGMQYTSILDMAISPAYSADGTIFASVPAGAGLGFYRTTDSGATWESLGSADYPGGGLAVSPQYADDHTIYATGQHGQVLRSSDGGDTWSPVGDLPPGVYSLEAWRVALPPDYPTDSTVFAAGSQGFWRLPPGVITWEPAASGLDAGVYVTSIAVSPDYGVDETLLATASWHEEPGEAYHYGVFRSTDGGVNWTLANIGLPDTLIEHVAFSLDYAADLTAYVTSESQLFRSLDGGLSWTAVGVPPGSPALYDVVVNNNGSVYVASSAGAWRYATSAQDIIINSGFEADSGWDLPTTPRPAGYSDRVAYDGMRSVRIGIDNGENRFSYSSARQVVTVPTDAISATLHCYVYPVSGESIEIAQSQAFPQNVGTDNLLAPGITGGDAQYLLILEPDTGANLQTLFRELSNGQSWQHHAFDLASYAGQTIRLHFGVYNDGAGGRTGMYVDNVSLIIKRPTYRQQQYLPLVLKNQGCAKFRRLKSPSDTGSALKTR